MHRQISVHCYFRPVPLSWAGVMASALLAALLILATRTARQDVGIPETAVVGPEPS